jgi:hypothetical protein
MPNVKIAEEGAEAVGELLQAYGESVGLTRRGRIDGLRRDRLRAELEGAGASVSAHAASVLADAMASGRLAVGETHMYLQNDGGAGVKARCRCGSGRGRCIAAIQFGKLTCFRDVSYPCRNCGFVLGLSIAKVVPAGASKPGQLGTKFIEQLPDGFAHAINELAGLSYPLADRLGLREQRQQRSRDERNGLVSRLSFPILTLADALDRLFDGRLGEASSPPVNQLRLAVGDYPTWVVRNLANAIGEGGVEVDATTRTLALRTKKPEPELDVDCFCFLGVGKCDLIYERTELRCGSGSCSGWCLLTVAIPSGVMYA